jgi:cell division protein FtsA
MCLRDCLSGYASSISSLDLNANMVGSLVLDIGSSGINLSLDQDNSLLYNSFLPFGSQHITNDISQTFNTPIIAAEMIKNQYATLVPFKEDDALLNKRIKAPMLGDETKSNEITLDSVQAVVHARVEEMLIMTYNTFIQSELESKVKAGIFLTGGLSKLPGLQSLAQQVFNNFNVQIGIIKNIPNEYIDFQDNSKSTLSGLIFYALKVKDSYELDYKRQLRINKSVKVFDNNLNNLDSTLEETSIEEIIDSLEQTLSKQDLQIPRKQHMVKEDYKKDDLVTRTLTNIKDWF